MVLGCWSILAEEEKREKFQELITTFPKAPEKTKSGRLKLHEIDSSSPLSQPFETSSKLEATLVGNYELLIDWLRGVKNRAMAMALTFFVGGWVVGGGVNAEMWVDDEIGELNVTESAVYNWATKRRC